MRRGFGYILFKVQEGSCFLRSLRRKIEDFDRIYWVVVLLL